MGIFVFSGDFFVRGSGGITSRFQNGIRTPLHQLVKPPPVSCIYQRVRSKGSGEVTSERRDPPVGEATSCFVYLPAGQQ